MKRGLVLAYAVVVATLGASCVGDDPKGGSAPSADGGPGDVADTSTATDAGEDTSTPSSTCTFGGSIFGDGCRFGN